LWAGELVTNKTYILPVINKAYDLLTDIVLNTMHLDPIETGRIAEHVYAIKTGTVNFFVYENGEHLICFDSGFGKNVIIRELNRLSLDAGKVTHLFLTHSDFDHAGGLALFEKAEVYLSSDEEQMIIGKKARMAELIYNPAIKRAHHLLNDNDVVTISSTKVRAITTPGHTPGSMSYLVNESILFVGDTFKLIEGKVYAKRPCINMDSVQQKESIRKLACLDHVRLVFTAHNGYTQTFDEAIRDWR
jgi:hydroxyacylglutathione hydrolase